MQDDRLDGLKSEARNINEDKGNVFIKGLHEWVLAELWRQT